MMSGQLGQAYRLVLAGSQRVIPSATTIVTVFAAFFFLKSLLPGTKTPLVTLPGGVYVDIKLLALFGWAAIIVCARVLHLFSYRPTSASKRYILVPLLSLAFLELVSVPFNGRTSEEQFYSVMECMELAAPVLIAVFFVAGLPYASRLRVGSGLVMLLAFIVVVYMGLSFVFPWFRPSHAIIGRTALSLGFIRVFGPLGNAASLATVLYPAMGFAVGMLFVPRRSKIFWGFVAFLMFAAIVGTGSRGAVLCLPIFGFLLLAVRLTKALQVVVPAGVLLVVVAVAIGVPERFRQFEDRARVATYQTSWNAFTTSAATVSFGTGHGRLFTPSFATTLRRVMHKRRWYMLSRETEYGFVLHGAHSTPMKVLAENGLVGFLLLAIPLWLVLVRLYGKHARTLRDPIAVQARFTLAGCVTAMTLMLVNTFFFAQPWLALIWLTLMVVGTETIAEGAS